MARIYPPDLKAAYTGRVGEPFDCVMPAAGASSRMGSWKPLLPWGAATLVEAAVGSALAAGLRVLLVVGHRGREISALFAGRERVVVVDNPDWERGMLGSIQKALPFVASEAFFCANADMPLIGPEDYRALAAAWEAAALLASARGVAAREASEAESPERGGLALFASHRGKAGHPVLLPRAWSADILALGPGERLRPFLFARTHRLIERGPGALLDLDTPEDYERNRGAAGTMIPD